MNDEVIESRNLIKNIIFFDAVKLHHISFDQFILLFLAVKVPKEKDSKVLWLFRKKTSNLRTDTNLQVLPARL